MITLYQIDPAMNMARFYAVTAQPTLFGEWSPVREWGQVGRSPQLLLNTFETRDHVADMAHRLFSAKQRRCYV